MRKIDIISVSTIIAIVIVIYYWQWIHSPKYSLLQVQKAIENHDIVSFEKYVDIQSLTERLIDQILDMNTTQQEQQVSEWDQIGQNIAKGFINFLKPQLVKLAKEQVTYYIEKGSFEDVKDKGEGPQFSLKEIWNKSGREKSKFHGFEYVKKEGKIAVVGLTFFYKEYNTKLVLDIKMREKDGYWQVAEISNFSDYIKKLEELELKRREELNKPIIEAMKKTLVLKSVSKSTYTDPWGIKKVVFKINFKNVSEKIIDEYKAALICKDSNGKLLKKIFISDTNDIKPGQSGGRIWTSDVNIFINNDNKLYDTPQEGLLFDAQIQYIKFADGSELKLHEE